MTEILLKQYPKELGCKGKLKFVLVLIGLGMKSSGSSTNQVPFFCLSTVALKIYKTTLILDETLLTQSCQSTKIAGSEEIRGDQMMQDLVR